MFAVSYLYVALAFFVVVFVALRFVNLSRTGRAWRSQREDSLAAEAMGMPVNWLKLLELRVRRGRRGVHGSLFAALNASVFPLSFYFVLLITVYTMVILGGSGSQPGVVLGALIVSPLLELLRDPGKSRLLFVAALIGGLVLASAARRSSRSSSRPSSSSASPYTRSRARSTRRGSRGAPGRRLRRRARALGHRRRRISTAGSRRSRTSA